MSDVPHKKLTRQEIYQEIRKCSKDEYILSEMIRLGFWEKDQEKPTLTESFISKRGELQNELRELGKELSMYNDPELALKELHKQRKKEALEKREKTKLARNLERYNKAKAWYDKNQSTITYLGEDISLGLLDESARLDRINIQALPVIESSIQLATMMGISINELRFLSYKRSVSKVSHYQHFSIPKKTGGLRDIAAPMPRLKRAQYWILENILNIPVVRPEAHGFVKAHSIATNAEKHVAKDVVINIDLENFFPSITFGRVKGVFINLGYSESISTILAAICTEADQEIVSLDGEKFYVDKGKPCLPQGAPTSPALSNLICRKLDRRMNDVTRVLGFNYTRYADDLTFSGDHIDDIKIKKIFWRINGILKDENFTLNKSKTRIMRKHRKQEVTGIVVNQKLSVDRKTIRKFRALLHQMDKQGIEGKSWGKGELFASITGYANFVAMVDLEKGTKLQKKVVDLKRKYKQIVKHGKIGELNRKLFRAKSAAGEIPREDWWFAKAKPVPILEKTPNQLMEEKRLARQASQPQKRKSNTRKITETSSNYEPPNEVNYGKIMGFLFWFTLLILWFAR